MTRDMLRKKISIAEYNELHKDVRDAKTELSEAMARFEEAQEFVVADNCSTCKGTGEVYEAGDPAHSQGDPVRRECSDCDGKGYIN